MTTYIIHCPVTGHPAFEGTVEMQAEFEAVMGGSAYTDEKAAYEPEQDAAPVTQAPTLTLVKG